MPRNTSLPCSPMVRGLLLSVLVLSGVLACGVGLPTAAAFPGSNGRIAFASNRSGQYDIYTIAAGGGGLTRLTRSGGNFNPVWSANGARLAFDTTRSPSGIYLMNANGSSVRFLTRGYDATWSPSGLRLAFVRVLSSGQQAIFSINVDGTGLKRLAAGDAFEPAWSPDGTRIAFTRDRASDGAEEIWTMKPDGSVATQLTFSAGHNANRNPAWSPSGTSIAWMRSVPNDCFTLPYVATMKPNGSAKTLIGQAGLEPEGLAWAPDATRFVFGATTEDATQPNCGSVNYRSEIFTMKTDGSSYAALTHVNAPINDIQPDWQAAP